LQSTQRAAHRASDARSLVSAGAVQAAPLVYIENAETVFKDGLGYGFLELIESIRGHVGFH
jgi:hypothetical protein